MQQVLPVLIDNACALRDRKAALVRQAQAQLEQSRATLARLVQFRHECLGRSPGAQGVRAGAGMHSDYQRFIARLDGAIVQQQQEGLRRQAIHEQAMAQLVQGQQRVLALQTLARRQQLAREARLARADQRSADEFAARAARLSSREVFT